MTIVYGKQGAIFCILTAAPPESQTLADLGKNFKGFIPCGFKASAYQRYVSVYCNALQ